MHIEVFKEELDWATDEPFWFISNEIVFKTVSYIVPLRK